jgi:preprotein translocase subunit SecE
MKEVMLKIVLVGLVFVGLGSFYVMGVGSKSYTLFLICLCLFVGMYYLTKDGKTNISLIKESVDDVKTYSLPKNKDVVNQTYLIVLIAIFLGIVVFVMDNIIRYFISLV